MKGISLSGGQKQRLNICRAIYCDADIQIFDVSFDIAMMLLNFLNVQLVRTLCLLWTHTLVRQFLKRSLKNNPIDDTREFL
jgi:ABC-type transport system involved in cytochrome bd biosynthesis fused ATPase/permease subunit